MKFKPKTSAEGFTHFADNLEKLAIRTGSEETHEVVAICRAEARRVRTEKGTATWDKFKAKLRKMVGV